MIARLKTPNPGVQVPALFGGLLLKCRRSVQEEKPTKLSSAVQFITREYKPLTYYWELVDLFRKLLLTGFMLLIPQYLSFLRLTLAVAFSICYLVLLMTAQPFRQRSTAFMAVATQLSLVLTLMSAMLVKFVGAVHKAAGSIVSTSSILGFSDAFPLTVTILCINFGVLLLVFGLIVQQAVDERLRSLLRRTIRLVSTGLEPELHLSQHFAFHGFLSHCTPHSHTTPICVNTPDTASRTTRALQRGAPVKIRLILSRAC